MTIPVKMHIVFDHVATFCDSKKRGLGFYSEQAGEAIHYSFLKESWERFKVTENSVHFMETTLERLLSATMANILLIFDLYVLLLF